VSLHLVESPFSLIHATVLVIEDALTVPHAFQLVSLVLTSLFVPLNNIIALNWWGGSGRVGGEVGDAVCVDQRLVVGRGRRRGIGMVDGETALNC
jgi:hypothetical protein